MTQTRAKPAERTKPTFGATLGRYVAIARPDHWIKNIFVLPGAAAAWVVVVPHSATPSIAFIVWAIVSVCLAASANYTINEYLDAESDRFHPTKSMRPGAMGLLDGRIVLLQYLLLLVASLGTAAAVGQMFFWTTVWLLLMGIIYNVAPLRTKDTAFLDTLSESINNPIRFLLGWFTIAPWALPPSSALLAYWMGGAFLMGVKRYSEYRSIGDPSRAALYRRSFGRYTEHSLLLMAFFCGLCSAFFIGVFLIKYRIEFALTFPLYAALFTWYLQIGLRRDSAAQAPEKLYKESWFMAFAAFTFMVSVALFFVKLPFMQGLMEAYLINIGGPR